MYKGDKREKKKERKKGRKEKKIKYQAGRGGPQFVLGTNYNQLDSPLR